MSDPVTIVAQLQAVADTRKAVGAAFRHMQAMKDALYESERACIMATADASEAENRLAMLMDLNKLQQPKPLTLDSARYTMSDVRV